MDAQTIVIITALIGILKGKDVWEYFKFRIENKSKGNDKIIDIYEKRILSLESEIKELRDKQDELLKRMESKILKRRGTKKEVLG